MLVGRSCLGALVTRLLVGKEWPRQTVSEFCRNVLSGMSSLRASPHDYVWKPNCLVSTLRLTSHTPPHFVVVTNCCQTRVVSTSMWRSPPCPVPLRTSLRVPPCETQTSQKLFSRVYPSRIATGSSCKIPWYRCVSMSSRPPTSSSEWRRGIRCLRMCFCFHLRSPALMW